MSFDNPQETPQLKPYLVRAVWQCCTDFGLTPYLRVVVDDYTQVPTQYVQNGEIILNISDSACANLNIGDDEITFRARFAGKAFEIIIPMGRVLAIFARENAEIGLHYFQIVESEPRDISTAPTPQIAPNPTDDDDSPPPPSGMRLVD